MIAMPVILLALATFQDEREWQPVTLAGGAFSVELPGDGGNELRSEPVPMFGTDVPSLGSERAVLREVIRNTGRISYMVSWIQVPGGPQGPEEARWLAAARRNATRISLRPKVLAEDRIQLGRISGRSFTVTEDTEIAPHMSWGRTYIRGDTIYSLAAGTTARDSAPPPDVVRFLGSFAFGDRPSPAGSAAAHAMEAVLAAAPHLWKRVAIQGKATVALPGGPVQGYFGGNLDEPLRGCYCLAKVGETPAAFYEAIILRNERGLPNKDDAAIFKVARREAVKQFGVEGEDLIEKPIHANSGSAREFSVTIDRRDFGKSKAGGRTYVTEDAAYVLLAVSRKRGRDLPAEADAFLDSFAPGNSGEAGPVPAHTLEAWGVPLDPTGDVAFTPAGDTLKLTIPGTPHLLAPEREIMNAPRIVAPTRGDFTASVRIGGPFEPGRDSTVKGLSSREGGGLIVWKDAKNYLVVQKRVTNDDGRFRHQVVLEELVDGRKGVTLRNPGPNGSVHLRLGRKGGRLLAAYGGDGERWEEMKPVETPWAEGVVQVGMVAVSTSPGPHAVTVEGYSLRER